MSTTPPPPMPDMPASGRVPENGLGTAGLVLGIVGLVLMCAYGGGIIFSVLAIIFGKMGMNKAAQGLATNGSSAKAGFIMGIIGTIVGVIVIIVVLVVVVGVLATDPNMTS